MMIRGPLCGKCTYICVVLDDDDDDDDDDTPKKNTSLLHSPLAPKI
jgi:hypothetical protein